MTIVDQILGMAFVDQILLGMALVFGFYMAWNIGANDVANAMGTSVGSKVLTLRNAIIVAAVLEFCGAYFLGSNVTDTIRKDMVDYSLFEEDIYSLVYGMIAALIAAGVWLQIATYYGWPVSTTHAIVGGVIGFIIVAKGGAAVNWNEVGGIVASWGVSPILSGTIAFVIFTLIRQRIFFTKDPFKSARRAAPFLIFLVVIVLSLVLLLKGLKNLNLDYSNWQSLSIAVAFGLIASVIGSVYISKFLKFEDVDEKDEEDKSDDEVIMTELSKVPSLLSTFSGGGEDELLKNRVSKIESEVKKLLNDMKEGTLSTARRIQRKISYHNTERIFAKLQVMSACFVAFAHGSNDVANAVGPIAAVVTIITEKSVAAQSPVPSWILVMGGIGIVIGLATWGYKVIYTIGEKITELSPSRGFSAEFAAAFTIVIASMLGLPISTTHTLVGAVLGVGFAQGVNSLNLRIVRDIISSWFITLPAAGILSIVFFFIIRAIFS